MTMTGAGEAAGLCIGLYPFSRRGFGLSDSAHLSYTSVTELPMPESPHPDTCRLGATRVKGPIAHVLSERLIWFRGLGDKTQQQLARDFGISRSALIDAEGGQTQVTLKTLMAFVVGYETEPSVLLGFRDPSEEQILRGARRRHLFVASTT
jgi:hypothetical protein